VDLWRYLRGTDLLEDSSNQPKGEARSLPPPENQLPLAGLPLIWSGVSKWELSPVEALAVADCWAAVRCLADGVSSLPLHVFRKTEQGRERVTSGRLVELLERPSPGVTEADLTSSLMTHLAVWGNAYLAKFREQGEVKQLGLLHPDRVRPELVDGQLRFRYDPPKGPQLLLTEADMIQIKGLSVDGVTGLSAVTQAARVLGLSDSLVKHAMSFFEATTQRPAGVLRLGTPDMTPREEGRQRTIEGLANEMKPHGLLVVEGDMEYQDVAHKMDDSQFVEQRRLATQEVCRVFRIPSHFLNAGTGGDSLTYSTSESMSIDFVKYSLTPWLRRIELAISGDRDLAFQRQYVRFETDGLLRSDAKTRAEVYQLALDPIQGWMTREEVRRLEDLEPESAPPAAAGNGRGIPQNIVMPVEVGTNGNQ
jgi:HK97 family phage portal protein